MPIRRWRPGRFQSVAPAPNELEVNWDNPLSAGLVSAGFGNSWPPRDLVSAGLTTLTTAPTFAQSEEGPAVNLVAASSQYITSTLTRPDAAIIPSAMSIIARILVTAPSGVQAAVTANGPSSGALLVGNDATGHALVGSRASSGVVSPASSATVITGNYATVGVSGDGIANGTGYLNGVSFGASANGGTISDTTTTTVTIGSRTAGAVSNFFNGKVLWWLVFSRSLSADEQFKLYADPLQLFRPVARLAVATPGAVSSALVGRGAGFSIGRIGPAIALALRGAGFGEGSARSALAVSARGAGIAKDRGPLSPGIAARAAGVATDKGAVAPTISAKTAGIAKDRAAVAPAVAAKTEGFATGRTAAAPNLAARAPGISTGRGIVNASSLAAMAGRALGIARGAGTLASALSARAAGIATGRGLLTLPSVLSAITGRAIGFARGLGALISGRINPNLIATAQTRTIVATADQRVRVVFQVSNQMAQTNNLTPPIDSTVERETVTFDFGPIPLADGVTITSILSLSCVVSPTSGYPVIDPNPSSRLIGSPQIMASPGTEAPLQAVGQLVGSMLGGCNYLLQCVVATSDGQRPSLWCHLPCNTPV